VCRGPNLPRSPIGFLRNPTDSSAIQRIPLQSERIPRQSDGFLRNPLSAPTSYRRIASDHGGRCYPHSTVWGGDPGCSTPNHPKRPRAPEPLLQQWNHSGRQEYSLAGGASGLAFPWIMGSPRLTDPAHSGIFTQVSILSAARLLIGGAVCVCGCMCS
jgi:hypothetical protein